MATNNAGQPVKEETIYSMCGQVFAFNTQITDAMRDEAIALLCEKLRVDIVLTNATKHGNTQLVFRDAE